MNSRPHAGSLHRLPSPASAYLTPDGIAARVEELRAAHGGRTFPIGSTREGRQILATSFGSAEPGHEQGGVLLLSLLHAYEWIGALTLLRLLERLLRVRASASHPPAPLVAVPIANPDGCLLYTSDAADEFR
ncbi:MAG: M14 family zinc carboxypeptidase, partial [Candidatus Eisenbacteria bacterium]|nr:M14 family zinc carboxypeptidase [Candidatus Eisenbacteria bacterium]